MLSSYWLFGHGSLFKWAFYFGKVLNQHQLKDKPPTISANSIQLGLCRFTYFIPDLPFINLELTVGGDKQVLGFTQHSHKDESAPKLQITIIEVAYDWVQDLFRISSDQDGNENVPMLVWGHTALGLHKETQ